LKAAGGIQNGICTNIVHGWLLFLSRIAVICNVFFLLSVSLVLFNWIHNTEVISFISIIGYILAGIFNPITVVLYLFVFMVARKKLSVVPGWIILLNVLFLGLQLLYIIYLNDTQHT
jgi:hypothetical protein